MSNSVESRSALYAAYSRILEYGKENILTTYVKDVSFTGNTVKFSRMDKNQDAAIYLLLYYGIYSDYRKGLSLLVPEIRSMLVGRVDFDCSCIEVEDVVSLFDSEVSHIPFEGYEEETEKYDYENLQKELQSIFSSRNIYEPFVSLTSFCLPFSCKYSSDRNEYLILSVYSFLAREAMQKKRKWNADPLSFGELVVFGEEGAEFSKPEGKFNGMVLYGMNSAETMEKKIREGLDLLEDSGIMVVLDFCFVLDDYSDDLFPGHDDKSLHLKNIRGKRMNAAQRIPALEPGTKYRLSYFIKTENLQSPGGAGAFLYFTKNKGKAFPGTQLADTHPWHRLTFEFVTPPDTGKDAVPVLGLWIWNAQGDAWFDDVRLEKVK